MDQPASLGTTGLELGSKSPITCSAYPVPDQHPKPEATAFGTVKMVAMTGRTEGSRTLLRNKAGHMLELKDTITHNANVGKNFTIV